MTSYSRGIGDINIKYMGAKVSTEAVSVPSLTIINRSINSEIEPGEVKFAMV